MRIFQPTITGSIDVSGSITAFSFTGSLQGTSSYALTASYAMNGGGGGASFPYTGDAVITGSLVVTGSLFGTASWAENTLSASYAQTASYLLGDITSASYASTSSYAYDLTIGDKLFFDGTLTDRATVLSTIVGTNNLFTQATGSYTSAFGKYTIFNGTNARAGEFITVWNGTTSTYTDVSTTDIGDTSPIVFSSIIVGSNIEIDAVAGASGWRIKMLTTFI